MVFLGRWSIGQVSLYLYYKLDYYEYYKPHFHKDTVEGQDQLARVLSYSVQFIKCLNVIIPVVSSAVY